MGTSFAAVQAVCPLCGSALLSVGRTGNVLDEVVHPVQVGHEADRGYSLCDDCGILTALPDNLTRN